MTQQSGPQPKRKILPPNLVAFLTGVLLALVIGLVFRKVIDQMLPQKAKTTMRAQSIETQQPVVANPAESADVKSNSSPANQAAESASAVTVTSTSTVTATSTITPQPHPDTGKNADTQSSSVEQKTAEKSNAEKLAKQDVAFPPAHEDTMDEESSGHEVEYTMWRKQLKAFEDQLTSQGVKNLNVMMTPRYRHQAKGLAITRGQFLDVVSKRIPNSLPTRQSNLSIIFHALAASDFDTSKFTKMARDISAQVINLCQPESIPINLESFERVSVLLSNNPQNFKCLTQLIETNPTLLKVQELSLIGFTRGPTFYASITSSKKLLSLQMWNPDWLLDNTVGLEEMGNEASHIRRAMRLANVTRALAQPSDVRMQIPASYRSLEGPLVEPRNPTPPKPLVVGNFALVPSHMPRGSLIATAFNKPGQDRSNSATVKPPGVGRTKALVLATQGKTLQFLSVSRE